jgi:hypothetical protein
LFCQVAFTLSTDGKTGTAHGDIREATAENEWRFYLLCCLRHADVCAKIPIDAFGAALLSIGGAADPVAAKVDLEELAAIASANHDHWRQHDNKQPQAPFARAAAMARSLMSYSELSAAAKIIETKLTEVSVVTVDKVHDLRIFCPSGLTLGRCLCFFRRNQRPSCPRPRQRPKQQRVCLLLRLACVPQ